MGNNEEAQTKATTCSTEFRVIMRPAPSELEIDRGSDGSAKHTRHYAVYTGKVRQVEKERRGERRSPAEKGYDG